jgi:hypothetical protein
MAKQSEKQTASQLNVENKLLKRQNKKYRDKAEISREREKHERRVRNYAIKEGKESDHEESVLNFFSSDNKNLQADMQSTYKRSLEASRSRSNNAKE